MKRLTVFDRTTGEVIEEREFSGGYDITYTCLENDGTLQHIRHLDNGKFDEKHWIKNEIYRPIVNKLVAKFYDEFSYIRPEKILFIEDTDWKPGTEDRPWIARTSKANKQLQAMTGYDFMIETRKWYTDRMSKEQIAALFYHELRHIDSDGSLLKHDIEDWEDMVATLGMNWATTQSEILDILGPEFDGWDELRKAGTQINIFDYKKEIAAGGGK